MFNSELLRSCKLCPKKCGANRISGDIGYCGASRDVRVARCALHFWEEPPISGTNGSGTVFFSNCPLKCVYCQNKKISADGFGCDISTPRLSDIFLELKELGAHNINLVSPTQYMPHIVEAVNSARNSGLHIPIVYNTGGYELTESIDALKDTVDIYLTDFKYMDENISRAFSHSHDYPKFAISSLRAMVKNLGKLEFNGDIMRRGVIVRHLLLPGYLENAKRVVEYLYKTYGDDIYLSLMNQYTPVSGVPKQINTRVSDDDYERLLDYAADLGVSQCFIQLDGAAQDTYIPDFDLSGVMSKSDLK